jgi:hypothetical protein
MIEDRGQNPEDGMPMMRALLSGLILQGLWRKGAAGRRFLILSLICLLITSSTAIAEPTVIDRTAKVQAGRDARIAVFANIRNDCTPGPLPTIKLKLAPTRGKITIKNAKFRATNVKHCLAIEVPAYVAIYRADADFSGNDIVELEVVEANGKQRIERLTISVGKTNKGEDI